MHTFKATIEIIGINPYVAVPGNLLEKLFVQAGRDKSPIPIRGFINDKPYKQTLVKYSGKWRLYINSTMLTNSPKRIGEKLALSIEFDPSERTIQPHPKFLKALTANKDAKARFDQLPHFLKNEIVRYISLLKTGQSIDKNIIKAIDFLMGKGRFVGRDRL